MCRWNGSRAVTASRATVSDNLALAASLRCDGYTRDRPQLESFDMPTINKSKKPANEVPFAYLAFVHFENGQFDSMVFDSAMCASLRYPIEEDSGSYGPLQDLVRDAVTEKFGAAPADGTYRVFLAGFIRWHSYHDTWSGATEYDIDYEAQMQEASLASQSDLEAINDDMEDESNAPIRLHS